MATPTHSKRSNEGWIDRYLADPLLSHEDYLRKRVIFLWFLVAASAILILTVFAFIIGVGLIGHFGLWLLLFYALVFPVYRYVHRYEQVNFWFLIVVISITAVYIGQCGGIMNSGGLIFVGLSCAFSSILMNSTRRTVVIFGWYAFTIILLGLLKPNLTVHPDMTPRTNNLFFVINTLWMSAAQMMFIISYFKEREKIKERETQRLKDLEEAKTRLYTNVTHEFRTPLTIILGLADQLKEKGTGFLEEVSLIRKNGKRLLRLVNELLGLARLESGLERVNLVRLDVIPYFHYLTDAFQLTAQNQGIDLQWHTDLPKWEMDLDQDKWEIIFGNLISNALKFTPKGGQIKVDVTTVPSSNEAKEDRLQLTIADNGPGIPGEELPHIFERFYQVEQIPEGPKSGSGIGLALASEYVKLLGGEIKVRSNPGEGTIFTVSLPVIRQAPLLAASLALTDQEEEELTLKTLPLHSPGLLPKSKPLILLVEDEEDLIIYLQSLLQSEYDLLTAPNGQQGWEMAVDYIPDIIVSDVMMPVMDGFAFLKKVKSNPRTSHIPAILLTARTDQAGKLEGLEKGAEAYLTKPFQKEELFIRIRKLLELRKTLQQRYRSMEEIPYEPASGFPLEDQFMSRIREILDSQLDNETFGITELCRELAMSRTQVYRKFSALTDMTVHQYLRRFRLHQAKKLLLRSDLPVSQVALEVGISNPSYFSRAFTKEFGINPSRVRRTSFS